MLIDATTVDKTTVPSTPLAYGKGKVKLIFRGAYRLSGTGIVELEIIDVGCNLKQLDGLT